MIDRFKKANSDIIMIIHSEGAVALLLDDIREIGFDVFNPVQPNVPGRLPHDLKNGLGNKLVFWGTVDQQDLLPKGTDQELERDIIEKINILAEMAITCRLRHTLFRLMSSPNVFSGLSNCVKSTAIIDSKILS